MQAHYEQEAERVRPAVDRLYSPFLTNPESISYLLSIQAGVNKEMGTIRTKEKCPICQNPFTHIQKLGLICNDHKTTPKKVYVDLSWQGQRIRIFSDKQGQSLDSYQRALNLQAKINHEIENHIFDPSKYIKAEFEKFWISNLLVKFLNYRIDALAPSYKKDFARMINVAKDFFKIV